MNASKVVYKFCNSRNNDRKYKVILQNSRREDCQDMGDETDDYLDMRTIIITKAHELFAVCDAESKGFITKQDMQRQLVAKMEFTREQLGVVFDSLDTEGGGKLTLQEFTEGFGKFHNILTPPQLSTTTTKKSVHKNGVRTTSRPIAMEKIYETLGINEEYERKFNEILDKLGLDTFPDQDKTIFHAMWMRLSHEEPELLDVFERFLACVTSELERTHLDYQKLEIVLRNKKACHDENIRRLYEEMEREIMLAEQERAEQVSEEKLKEKRLRTIMEEQLAEKERQLQDMAAQNQQTELSLHRLSEKEKRTKEENTRLLENVRHLEKFSNQNDHKISFTNKEFLYTEKKKDKNNKEKQTARVMLTLGETIILEHASLMKQLELLREMNRRLEKSSHGAVEHSGEKVVRKESYIQHISLTPCQRY